MDKLFLLHAEEAGLPVIKSLYRSMIGHAGCTWDEEYPDEETIKNDFKTNNLYVLKKDTEVIGAISVVPVNELDDLSCWSIANNVSEIARVVISEKYQGQGYAKKMVTMILETLAEQGCKAVHLLVSTGNPAAMGTYKANDFERKGECFRYGHNYYAEECILF